MDRIRLFGAVRRDDISEVQRLIAKGVSLAVVDENLDTCLHLAVSSASLQLIELLIMADAPINSENKLGKTPLHVAVEARRAGVVGLLLQYNADVNCHSCGKTPLDIAREREDVSLALALSERMKGQGPVSPRGRQQTESARVTDRSQPQTQTRIRRHPTEQQADSAGPSSARPRTRPVATLTLQQAITAIYRRDSAIDIVAGCSSPGASDTNGMSLLHHAAGAQYSEMVRLLLTSGANIDALDRIQRTPLHIAARGDCGEVVAVLCDPQALNSADSRGWTPLHVAAFWGRRDIVQQLLEAGASSTARSDDGRTPLRLAVERHHRDVAALFPDRRDPGAHPPSPTRQRSGMVPEVEKLISAALNADLELVCQFVRLGAPLIAVGRQGLTPLLAALESGSLDAVEILLESGADCEQEGSDGLSPVQKAASSGSVHMLRLLLDFGAAPDSPMSDGRTPLMLSAASNHPDCIRLLCAAGCRVDGATPSGRTALHSAAECGQLEAVRELLLRGATVDQMDGDGNTALHLAARGGWAAVTQHLLASGASPQRANVDGRTAEALAAADGHAEVARCIERALPTPLPAEIVSAVRRDDAQELARLLDRGVGVDSASPDGWTPLQVAAQLGRTALVRLLLERGANPNCTFRDAETPLWIAVFYGHHDIVDALLQHGADPGVSSSGGMTPLYMAVLNSDLELTRVLVKGGADPRMLSRVGKSPLQVAHERGSKELIELLESAGVSIGPAPRQSVGGDTLYAAIKGSDVARVRQLVRDDVDVQVVEGDGFSLLFAAVLEGSLGVVKWLISHGAKANSHDREGWTPLHWAAAADRDAVCAYLIDRGAEIDAQSSSGETPLHVAVRFGASASLSVLLKRGANPFITTSQGRNALHMIMKGDAGTADKLIAVGLSLGSTDSEGSTPLHVAAEAGDYELVRWMVEHGASPDTRDKNGATPLSLSVNFNYCDIEKYLRSINSK